MLGMFGTGIRTRCAVCAICAAHSPVIFLLLRICVAVATSARLRAPSRQETTSPMLTK
jgi:hypothetical protein